VLSERSAWTTADSRAGAEGDRGLRLSEAAEIAIVDPAGELHLMRSETGWSVRERARLRGRDRSHRGAPRQARRAEDRQRSPCPKQRRPAWSCSIPSKAAGRRHIDRAEDAKGGSLGRLLSERK